MARSHPALHDSKHDLAGSIILRPLIQCGLCPFRYTEVSTAITPMNALGRKMLTQTTDNTTFLRGTVETDANGLAAFQTILPGWYQGRSLIQDLPSAPPEAL